MGRLVHDWDFAVNRGAIRLARSTADALGGAYYTLDAERGTGRVILPPGDGGPMNLDFAELRGKSLHDDLLLRDFTINAMALDEAGVLIDPLDGQSDLEALCLRATSEAAFRDDPLRTVRAVRLAGQLSLVIEPQTAAWILRDGGLLRESSKERVRDEFIRLLMLPGAAGLVQQLSDFGLLESILEPVERLHGVAQSWPHRFDVWKHTLHVLDNLEGVVAAAVRAIVPELTLSDAPRHVWADIASACGRVACDVDAHLSTEVSSGRDRMALLKVAVLLHNAGKATTLSRDDDGAIHFYGHGAKGAEAAKDALEQLRLSARGVARVTRIVRAHLRPGQLGREPELTRRAVYRYYRDLGDAGIDVVLLGLADYLATWGPNLRKDHWKRHLDVAKLLLENYFEHYEEAVCPPVLLSGRDVIDELGVDPGPEVGRVLEAIREAQAAREVSTREEALALAREVACSVASSGIE